jgi:hypothetical protein
MDFNKEDRPFGEKMERRTEETKQDAKEKGSEIKEDLKGGIRRAEGALTGDKEKKREHEPSSIEKAFGAGDDSNKTGSNAKEDLKGAARRVEGEIKNDEGLKQEHEPSMLEKAGETLSNAAQYVKDTVVEGAQKVGLVSEDNTRKE